MAKSRFIQNNFVSGELSPLMRGRTDINQYYQPSGICNQLTLHPCFISISQKNELDFILVGFICLKKTPTKKLRQKSDKTPTKVRQNSDKYTKLRQNSDKTPTKF